MRTVTFKSVLVGAGWLGGLDLVSLGLTSGVASELTHHINTAYRMAWDLYDWPEALGYVEATLATHPTVAGAKYVPYVAGDGSYEMKAVYGVVKEDPRVMRQVLHVEHRLGPDGIYFPQPCSETEVWVEFRSPAVKFTNVAWSAVTAYVTGDLVYDAATGNVWRAKQGSTNQAVGENTYWTLVPFMAVLDEAVKAAAHEARVRAQGREDVAAMIRAAVEEHLESEIEVLDLQSARSKRTTRR